MLTFLHGADFHLDAPFTGLSAEKAAQRRGEQRETLERFAALARERKADLVLLSGDLADGRETYRETLEALSRALGAIPAPVFLAPGNHDWYGPDSVYAAVRWPDNVHIFTRDEIEAVELPELGCVVYGAAFTGPYRDGSPLEGFRAPADGRTHIMALHGDVDGHGRYGSIRREDIAQSGLTYLALGHIHACSGPQRAGDTVWAYPGCPEGRGFDELGEKGVLWGTVRSGDVALEAVPLGTRRYEIRRIDVSEAGAEAALRAALPDTPSRDICRFVLTGSRDEAPNVAALTELARPWFYMAQVRDETRQRQDLWRRLEEDSLTGAFLREMRRRLEGAPAEERDTLELAARFGLAALENGEEPCP